MAPSSSLSLSTTQKTLRQAKGLFDFCMAVLCLWAAYFHTPAGALFREAAGWLFAVHSNTQPVLSYFRTGPNGGAAWTDRAPPAPLRPSLAPAPLSHVGSALDAREAYGYGACAVLRTLGSVKAARALALADANHVSSKEMLSPVMGPDATKRLLDLEAGKLGSMDAAVVALFAGEDVARFGVERAKAEGEPADLDALTRALGAENEEALQAASRAVSLATAYSLRWPVSVTAPVTSSFGLRLHPVTHGFRLHAGLDLSLHPGTEVHATGDGQVRRASEDALNGRMVIVDHGHGVATLYCHNEKLLVRKGDRVHVGDVVALSGATGRVTGPHLHYQLELSDVPVDPLHFRSRSQIPPQLHGTGAQDLP